MKKIFSVSRLCVVALMCVLFLGVGMKAEAAAPGAVSGLKQINDTATSVTLQWSVPTGSVAGYFVEYCENRTFSGTTYKWGEAEREAVTIPGLVSGKTYYARVSAFHVTGTQEDPKVEMGTASSIVEVVTAPAGRVTELKQTAAAEKSISFSWKKAGGANGYILAYKNTKGASKEVTLKDVSSYKLSASANAKYQIGVIPIRKSSSGYVAEGMGYAQKLMTVLPGKVSKVKLMQTGTASNPKAGVALFSWNPNVAADGYEYEVYGNNNKRLVKKTTKGYANVKVSSSKLTNDQFLKIRVRAYATVNGKKKYGKWSDNVWFAKYPKNIKASLNASGIKLSWSKVKGAKNYTIYASTNPGSGYKKVGTTSKTSLTIKKIGGKNVAAMKRYYVKVVPNKKVGKKTFTGDKGWYTSIMFTYRYR